MSLKERLVVKENKTVRLHPNVVHNIEKLKENASIKNQKDDFDILEELFQDEDVTYIYINGAKNIYIHKKGKTFKSNLAFVDDTRLISIIQASSKLRGLEFDENHPYVDFKISDGIFLNATMPPVSNVPVVNIKFYREHFAKISKFLSDRAISKEIALTLGAIISLKENILIIGKKNTFKTTLLSALAKNLGKNARGIIADSRDEITFSSYLKENKNRDFPCDFENFTHYNLALIKKNCDKEFLQGTLNSIIACDCDRIFFNSPDDDTIFYILQKLEYGQKGIVMTLEADNLDDALERLTTILLKNYPYLSYKKAKLLVTKLFDIALVCDFDESGKRKLTYVTEMYNEHGIMEVNDIFFSNPMGEQQSGGFTPRFYKKLDINFIPIGLNIFDVNYRHTYDKSFETIEDIPYKVSNLEKKEKELNDEITRIRALKTKTNSQMTKLVTRNLEKLKEKAQQNAAKKAKDIKITDKIEKINSVDLEKISLDNFEDE